MSKKGDIVLQLFVSRTAAFETSIWTCTRIWSIASVFPYLVRARLAGDLGGPAGVAVGTFCSFFTSGACALMR